MNIYRPVLSVCAFSLLGLFVDLSSDPGSNQTTGGGYRYASGDVVADPNDDLFLIAAGSDRKYSLIPVAPTRDDANVYEYASWRSREMQTALSDLNGTFVDRVSKAVTQLRQSAVDGIIFASSAGGRLPAWLAGAQAEGPANSNWFTSPWLGSFHLTPTPWIYHAGLGWLHVSSDDAGNIWLWRQGQGWCWTGKDIYPWLYRQETGGWIYFIKSSSGKVYFLTKPRVR
tara:strand:+ start:4130 stop:4813 length:684 start_codon:yes stop_codon:yes gene_type:complete